jgi:hypothetical protein
MLWEIAIADNRIPGYQHVQVEIDRTQPSRRLDGKDVALNDDRANVRGGLYRRYPWFGTDTHDPIPLAYSKNTAPSFCALARARIASGISGAPRPALAFRRGI